MMATFAECESTKLDIPRRKAGHPVTEETPGTFEDFRYCLAAAVPYRSMSILQVAKAHSLNIQPQHSWTGADDQSPPEPENRKGETQRRAGECTVTIVEL